MLRHGIIGAICGSTYLLLADGNVSHAILQLSFFSLKNAAISGLITGINAYLANLIQDDQKPTHGLHNEMIISALGSFEMSIVNTVLRPISSCLYNTQPFSGALYNRAVIFAANDLLTSVALSIGAGCAGSISQCFIRQSKVTDTIVILGYVAFMSVLNGFVDSRLFPKNTKTILLRPSSRYAWVGFQYFISA